MARPRTAATALLAALLLTAVRGYPAGFFSCDNMPGHGSLAGATGFTVTLRNSVGSAVTAWTAGEAHTVTMARSGGAFRGFVAAVFPGASWGTTTAPPRRAPSLRAPARRRAAAAT